MKAIWRDVILAESNDTVVIENNHYFPIDSVNMAYFSESDTTTFCGWKGTAHYYHITVDAAINRDGAWYYAKPKAAAQEIQGRVAFWNGVDVVA